MLSMTKLLKGRPEIMPTKRSLLIGEGKRPRDIDAAYVIRSSRTINYSLPRKKMLTHALRRGT